MSSMKNFAEYLFKKVKANELIFKKYLENFSLSYEVLYAIL